MRSLPLILIAAWAIMPCAQPQAAASQPAASQQATSQPAASQQAASQPAASQQAAARPAATRAGAAAGHASGAAHPARHSPARDSGARRGTRAGRKSAAAAGPDGVLALGATDITGNKELPKVMVIVPWKGSPGAGAVARPMDSLMDEVLGPVDRAAFQRRIRYYGQINAPAVAPVGDSH